MTAPLRYATLDGHEVRPTEDLVRWSRWFENFENRKVAVDTVAGKKISTVFLGLNHQWGEGKPLWFETMIFDANEAELDCERFETWDEAVAGHAAACALIRNALT